MNGQAFSNFLMCDCHLAWHTLQRLNFIFLSHPASKEHYHNKSELLGAAHGFRDRKIPVDMIVQGRRKRNRPYAGELPTARLTLLALVFLSTRLALLGLRGLGSALGPGRLPRPGADG